MLNAVCIIVRYSVHISQYSITFVFEEMYYTLFMVPKV